MDNLSSLMPVITGSTAVAGTAGNILEEYKKMQYQNYVMDLMKNPQKLAALVAKLQQPLNNGLTQAVGNQVQGNMAERGLSQAPGVFAASESQALAPYYQQNQNAALQSVMQMLGMPAGSFGSSVNTSGSMQSLMNSLKNRNTGTGSSDSSSGIQYPSIPADIGPPLSPDDPTAPTFDPSWLGSS